MPRASRGRCAGEDRRRGRRSISPSRRRAIPKRAWSSGWRSSASAGRRPMPSTLQTLKDRDYVRVEKNRFVPEESGRLVTAFLERFFERYVSYDFTAELEEELDDVSGGRLDWQKVLDDFWRDFKPKAGEVMEQKPSRDHRRRSTSSSRPSCSRRATTAATRGSARSAATGGWRCAAASSARSSPAPTIPSANTPRSSARAASEAQASDGPTGARRRHHAARPGGSGPMSSAARARRPSAPRSPRTCRSRTSTSNGRASCCRCRARSARIPRRGKPITASIGRYGPYLAHDGKYAKLGSTAEVFETGMNAAVAKLADAAAGGGRQRGGSREPIAVLGAHPASGEEIKVMEGRYGPYVTDGTTNATLPKGSRPEGGDAGRSRPADRRARGQGPGEEEGGRKAGTEEGQMIDIELQRLPHGEGLAGADLRDRRRRRARRRRRRGSDARARAAPRGRDRLRDRHPRGI